MNILTILETILLGVFIAILVVISHWIGQLAPSWMPIEATAEAQKIDQLFSFLVALGTFMFLAISGVILYSIIFFRASPQDYSEGHPSRGDVRLEILWTVVPTVLVLWVAFQGYNIYEQLHISGLTAIAMHMHLEESADAQTINNNNKPKPVTQEIEVIAKQWVWSFRYPGNITSTQLHLPINQDISLKMHSEDVIHGFYVPEFRLKQDIIPNHTINILLNPIKAGKYRLKDSQFSGTYFPLMEADVYVESPQAYSHWLELAAAAQPTLASNKAFLEHNQPAKKMFDSHWQTVPPSEPPMVNDYT